MRTTRRCRSVQHTLNVDQACIRRCVAFVAAEAVEYRLRALRRDAEHRAVAVRTAAYCRAIELAFYLGQRCPGIRTIGRRSAETVQYLFRAVRCNTEHCPAIAAARATIVRRAVQLTA